METVLIFFATLMTQHNPLSCPDYSDSIIISAALRAFVMHVTVMT